MTNVPSSLDMKDFTVVWVLFEGKKHRGVFRGPAPDGSYAVRLDSGWLISADTVELE